MSEIPRRIAATIAMLLPAGERRRPATLANFIPYSRFANGVFTVSSR